MIHQSDSTLEWLFVPFLLLPIHSTSLSFAECEYSVTFYYVSNYHCLKSVPVRSFSWSAFSRIWNEFSLTFNSFIVLCRCSTWSFSNKNWQDLDMRYQSILVPFFRSFLFLVFLSFPFFLFFLWGEIFVTFC